VVEMGKRLTIGVGLVVVQNDVRGQQNVGNDKTGAAWFECLRKE